MIYADYNGTAPLSSDVRDYLLDRIENGPYANPNAGHAIGQKIQSGMERCRGICAQNLGAKPKNIIFNSGSSEGISTVFHSVLDSIEKIDKKYIVISPIEHAAVINNAKFYQTKGFELIWLEVNTDGHVIYEHFLQVLRQKKNSIALVSVMAANNETGVIQPFLDIASKCHELEIPFLCDTTQYIGKLPFNFLQSKIDFAVVSGHKIGALPGCGLILAKERQSLRPLIQGGGQEKGLRGGTQNYIGIETLAVALSLINDQKGRLKEIETARDFFEKDLKDQFPDLTVVGEKAKRLPNTSLISYPNLTGELLQRELAKENIFVTTSSACSDHSLKVSNVLLAMGITDEVGRGVIRISLGICESVDKKYDKILKTLRRIYEKNIT